VKNLLFAKSQTLRMLPQCQPQVHAHMGAAAAAMSGFDMAMQHPFHCCVIDSRKKAISMLFFMSVYFQCTMYCKYQIALNGNEKCATDSAYSCQISEQTRSLFCFGSHKKASERLYDYCIQYVLVDVVSLQLRLSTLREDLLPAQVLKNVLVARRNLFYCR
jgi:hypothetical protein